MLFDLVADRFGLLGLFAMSVLAWGLFFLAVTLVSAAFDAVDLRISVVGATVVVFGSFFWDYVTYRTHRQR